MAAPLLRPSILSTVFCIAVFMLHTYFLNDGSYDTEL